jgi:phage terminase large subunit-like protein
VLIAALLEQAPRRARSYAFAADRDQSALLLDALAGFVDRTPGLGGAFKIDNYRVTAERTGASLSIEASDDASAWGLRPWLVVADEFAQWKTTPGPRRLWTAVFSALPKVAGSRLACLTSAGDPAHWSFQVLQRAKVSPRWRVSEVPGPTPWIDPDELVEQRAALRESEFARLHLNEWTAPEDRLTTPDDLAACVTLEGPLPPDEAWAGDYVVAADLGVKRDRSVVAVCHLEPWQSGASAGDRVVLDRLKVWTPTREQPVPLGDVEAFLLQAAEQFGAPVVVDPWQAVGMAERLRSRGVVVQEFTFSAQSVGRLALTLHGLIRDHALALPDDGELLEELANVRLRESAPGVVRMDHDPDKHDDRAVTLALAGHWLLNRPIVAPSTVVTAEELGLVSGPREISVL